MTDELEFKDINFKINSFAQDRIEINDLMDWFEQQDIKYKKDILTQTWDFLQNTRPTQLEIEEGITKSGQKDTFTAATLLRKFNFNEARHKISNLPDSELTKTLRYVVSIFKISDTRRRTLECKGQCGHFWHNIDFGL